MSLILEALRKAEAERQAGKAPSLHAPAFPENLSRPSRGRAARSGMALIAALAVAAAGLFFWRGSAEPASASASASASALASASASAPAPAVAPVSAPQPLPSAAPRQAAAQPSPAAAQPAAPAPIPAPASAPIAPIASVASIASIAPAAPSTATPPSIEELPADLRQTLPALVVGGYIYADKPADRMVVLNQKLLREGDSVAPGLTLERLTPGGMILNLRGQRFRLPY